MKTNLIIATTCFVLAGAAIPSHAAVVTDIQFNGGNVLPSPIIAISTDLLQTSVSSADNELTAANLRNGQTGLPFNFAEPNPAIVMPSSPFTTTYNLDISTNTLGYDITEFRLFSGWIDDRAGQTYTIEYSLVGNATFTNLASVNSLQNGGSLLTRTYDTTSVPLISGVDAVRFTFSFPSGISSHSTVYREIDVLGTATIPEPSTVLLGGLGLGLLTLLRRRRA
ncbi:MAG: PEP-CTERM sorting domain-containing protein [Verrucomicrobia bacterium]|nr:PEP-CTERM sorting domain-containing protein [Verrucomicrobiota bacterium]